MRKNIHTHLSLLVCGLLLPLGALSQQVTLTEDNPEVSVTISNITSTGFHLATEMFDNTGSYYIACADHSILSQASLEEIRENVTTETKRYTHEVAGELTQLVPGTTQILFLFPYNADGEPGTLVMKTVTLPSQGGEGLAEVALTSSKSSANKLNLALTMNDQTGYYYVVYGATDDLRSVPQREIVNQVLHSGLFMPYSKDFSGTLQLVADTAYTLYVIPCNAHHEPGTILNHEVQGSKGRKLSPQIQYAPADAQQEESAKADHIALYDAMAMTCHDSAPCKREKNYVEMKSFPYLCNQK